MRPTPIEWMVIRVILGISPPLWHPRISNATRRRRRKGWNANGESFRDVW